MPDGLSRREFVAAMSGLALAGISTDPAVTPFARRHRLQFGIQLYTVRELLSQDLEGTLERVAAIGYREVELAGLYDRPADDFRRALDRCGLIAPSGHVGIPAITDQMDRTIEEAHTLGHQYLILPWVPEEFRTRDGFARIADTLNRAGERLRSEQLMLGYHNHEYEFAGLPGGGIGYDIILERTEPGLVVMELDLFWIRKGGGDALHYFRDHPGRFRLVHLKDSLADGTMTDVGLGVIGWRDVLLAASHAGVKHFYVEHDQPVDPLATVRRSYGYLQSLHL
jgi:sugar phosphate isomerase/epimerase